MGRGMIHRAANLPLAARGVTGNRGVTAGGAARRSVVDCGENCGVSVHRVRALSSPCGRRAIRGDLSE